MNDFKDGAVLVGPLFCSHQQINIFFPIFLPVPTQTYIPIPVNQRLAGMLVIARLSRLLTVHDSLCPMLGVFWELSPCDFCGHGVDFPEGSAHIVLW